MHINFSLLEIETVVVWPRSAICISVVVCSSENLKNEFNEASQGRYLLHVVVFVTRSQHVQTFIRCQTYTLVHVRQNHIKYEVGAFIHYLLIYLSLNITTVFNIVNLYFNF